MPCIPENELERALVAAAQSREAASDFYRLLLETNLLVLGTVEGLENASEQFTLGPNNKLNLVPGTKNGSQYLPVFSSRTRMQDYIKQESKYLSINGRALLDLTRGAPVTLNPASEYGKELSVREVQQLLDGTAGGERIITGEADYPLPLVQALTALFVTRPDIENAWMIQVTFADRAKEPHPLVGIETAGDWPSLLQAIQAVAESQVPGMVFDIQRVDRRSPAGMTGALLQAAPFYQRRPPDLAFN